MRSLPSAWAGAMPARTASALKSSAARRRVKNIVESRMPARWSGVESERRVAFDRGAVQLAALVVRGAGGQVHQRAVVPEHHVVRRPGVAVDVLGPCAVLEQFGQQRA